jgi:hypothetical protein
MQAAGTQAAAAAGGGSRSELEAAAERELQRPLCHADLRSMSRAVIGQFNLGFIFTK